MPFTVSCAACNSRFLLGDDLFRRKVAGKVVTVKCRSCNAEISVDATEPTTLPSHEAPARRGRPAPPRKLREGETASVTPLPGDANHATAAPPLARVSDATATPSPAGASNATAPGNATITPLIFGTSNAAATPSPARVTQATATPLPTGALLSIWDAAEKNVEAPHRAPLPRPHAPPRVKASEPQFIEDIEEGPPSSSDAPSLDTLTHETSPKKQTAFKKAPDDFLVNLSGGTGGILGAPTIDVMGLGSPPPAGGEELLEVEATELTPRAGTLPLFDMSAVLPAANGGATALGSSLSPSHVDLSVDVEIPETPSQSGKPRQRKYVVAPTTNEAAASPKPRRAGAAVWFLLVAAAASVLLVVGLREHASSHHTGPEPQPAGHPPSVAENAPTTIVTPGIAAVVASEATPVLATTNSPTPSKNAPTPNAASGPKSAELASPAQPEAPTAGAAVEPPAVAEKPTLPTPRAMPEPAQPDADFDRAAALAALKAAAAEAGACRKDGDPSGTASLTITFAPSGRVTSANIQGPPFAGTPTGGCIANAMRHAHVPAFSGERVTVSKTIVIQ